MPAPTAGCLFTTIKNTSGGAKHFGFLPPHGVTLAEDQEIQVFGNVYDAIKTKRAQDAFSSAVSAGDLEIKSSPCVVVYDETDQASYRVGIDNGTVIATETNYSDDEYASL